jgi:hypothetical protein
MDSASEKVSRASARIVIAGSLEQSEPGKPRFEMLDPRHQLDPLKFALVKTELELCVDRRLLSRF